MSKFCEFCGSSLDDKSKFCSVCGKAIITTTLCPGCGTSVEKTASFCIKCGYSLKAIAQHVSSPSEIEMAPLAVEAPEISDEILSEAKADTETVEPDISAPALSQEEKISEAVNVLQPEPAVAPAVAPVPVLAQGPQAQPPVTPQYAQLQQAYGQVPPQQAQHGFVPPPQFANPQPQIPQKPKKKSSPIAVAILLFIILMLIAAGAFGIMYITGFMEISFK